MAKKNNFPPNHPGRILDTATYIFLFVGALAAAFSVIPSDFTKLMHVVAMFSLGFAGLAFLLTWTVKAVLSPLPRDYQEIDDDLDEEAPAEVVEETTN